jgi:hypothetical protein
MYMHLFCILFGRIKVSQAAETYSTFTGSGNEQKLKTLRALRRHARAT